MTNEQLGEIEAQINEFGEESGFILPLVKAQRDELDRLHILVHRIHALTTEETPWETFPGMAAKYLREIHELTTEAVEHGNG